MRVLFIVPYPPNLIRVRPYNLVHHLRRLGDDVTIATLWTSDDEYEDVLALERDGFTVIAEKMPRGLSYWNCVRALPAGEPLQSVYSWNPTLARRLDDVLNHTNGNAPFDVVHVEHLRGARYGLYLQGRTLVPVVWDSVDCISLLFEQATAQSKSRFGRIATRFELGRTTRYERRLVTEFDPILVTSPVDRSALLDLVPAEADVPVIAAFHGVDVDYFCPDPEIERDPATVVVTGKMSYHANVTMVLQLAHDIMPRVWQYEPHVRLEIVGSAPSAEIQALAANPAITVTGRVDDIRPYLRRATVAVAPIAYGAGVQNKILEAMACATPVVTTSQGCAALEIVRGRDLVEADGPEAFADAILELLADPQRRNAVGAAGRRAVTTNYSWANNTVRLQEVYHELVRQSE